MFGAIIGALVFAGFAYLLTTDNPRFTRGHLARGYKW